ncbi:hypothetical protein Tco_0983641, partial [Tanacetum coccineum]
MRTTTTTTRNVKGKQEEWETKQLNVGIILIHRWNDGMEKEGPLIKMEYCS